MWNGYFYDDRTIIPGFPGFPGGPGGFPGGPGGFPGGPGGFPGGPGGFPGGPGGFPGGPGGFPGGPGGFPGGPGGFPGGGFGPPTTPPPSFIPSAPSGGVGTLAVDPGAIVNCRFRFVYIWERNGDQYWAFLTFVGRQSVAGFRWTGFRWRYFGVDLRQINRFFCY
jgi:hypothetical protein